MAFLLGLGLASCSDDYTEWASPIHNDQEDPVTITGFTATAADPIDLDAIGDAKTVTAFNLNTSNLPEGYSVSAVNLVLTPIDANARNSNPTTLSSSVDLVSHAGNVSVEDLTSAVTKAYGISRAARNFSGQVLLSVTTNGSATLTNISAGTVNVTVTPVAPEFPEFLYEIGNESGWSANNKLYSAENDGNYVGYYYLNGEFKFKPNADDWTDDYEYDGEGKITTDGKDNIPDPGEGFYRISVNLSDLSYSLLKVENISMIGTVQGNWDTDLDMTYNEDTGNWEWTGELNAGSVKFRINHDWTYSFGGKSSDTDFENLTESDGKNLTVSEAGTYKVTLTIHQEDGGCSVSFEKQ